MDGAGTAQWVLELACEIAAAALARVKNVERRRGSSEDGENRSETTLRYSRSSLIVIAALNISILLQRKGAEDHCGSGQSGGDFPSGRDPEGSFASRGRD